MVASFNKIQNLDGNISSESQRISRSPSSQQIKTLSENNVVCKDMEGYE